MSRDIEVEEGQEVVRRTIVGGRPRSREKRRIRVPIGLEKVLCRAAGDAAFRQRLLADRDATLAESGYELLPTERAVLASVPRSTLDTMIANIDVREHGRKRFMSGVMAAAFAATATMAIAECGCTGIEPDMPPSDTVDEVLPSDSTSGGDAVTPASDVITGPDVSADAGSAPDLVNEMDIDIGEPMPAGILPDGFE